MGKDTIIGATGFQEQMVKNIDIVKAADNQGRKNILNKRKMLKVLIRKKNGNKKRKSTRHVLYVKDDGKKYLVHQKQDLKLQKIT